MAYLIDIDGRTVVSGFDWIPIDSLDTAKEEVKTAILRRKDDIADGISSPAFGRHYVISQTNIGTYAVGIIYADENNKQKIPKDSVSLASLCASYCSSMKMADAIFAWGNNEDTFTLVAIKNGLPIFDNTLGQSDFESEISTLMPLFETGVTVFGDDFAMPPPVAPMSIASLLTAEKSEANKFFSCGSNNELLAGIFIGILFLGGIGGYLYNNHLKKEAALQAEADAAVALQAASAVAVVSPEEAFSLAQSALLADIPGCTNPSVAINSSMLFHANLQSFRFQSVTADCLSGKINGVYKSGIPVDLTARSIDGRLTLDETLSGGNISSSFETSKNHIDDSNLLKWQDWLVRNGKIKQRVSNIGINVSFSEVKPVSSVVFTDKSRVVMIGTITISGNAIYLTSTPSLFNDVIWKTVTINSGRPLTFNLTGDYYAIKD